MLNATDIKIDEALRNHHGASRREEKDKRITVSVAETHTGLMAAQQKGACGRQPGLDTYIKIFKVLKLFYHISTVSY